MPATLVIALAEGHTGNYPASHGEIAEDVTITGTASVANDTGVYRTIMKRPQRFEGAFAASFSGREMTLTDLVGIGNRVFSGRVIGLA